VKIFLAATSLKPEYGGPAYSVARLAAALGEAGADVGLWSADPSPMSVASSVRPLEGSESEALRAFGRPDILHDNGIWRPHNHRLADWTRRQHIPRLVSPRGMLEPWAMNHKAWKKKLAWLVYQHHDLAEADCLHATAEAEATTLRRLFPHRPVRVIPNGVDAPEDPIPSARESAHRTALFLGRLYPVKGLPMLIEAWARLKPAGWRLILAGPDEAGHRAELEALVAATDLRQSISFAGPISAAEKGGVFAAADLFILPSHSESFGMSIAEALAHGLPVLTTTGAPWPELAEAGCGWQVAPSVDGLVAGMAKATAHDPETLSAMGAKGREWMRARFVWREVASQFIAAYENILAARPKRDSSF
jgi:glycosyltransferase involved in cell wall biosynthesis